MRGRRVVALAHWFAIAKIAGLKLCQAYRRQHGCDFVSVVPTNLYGPNDNFDLPSGRGIHQTYAWYRTSRARQH